MKYLLNCLGKREFFFIFHLIMLKILFSSGLGAVLYFLFYRLLLLLSLFFTFFFFNFITGNCTTWRTSYCWDIFGMEGKVWGRVGIRASQVSFTFNWHEKHISFHFQAFTCYIFVWMVICILNEFALTFRLMPESALTAPKDKKLSGRQWFESGRASTVLYIFKPCYGNML